MDDYGVVCFCSRIKCLSRRGPEWKSLGPHGVFSVNKIMLVDVKITTLVNFQHFRQFFSMSNILYTYVTPYLMVYVSPFHIIK